MNLNNLFIVILCCLIIFTLFYLMNIEQFSPKINREKIPKVIYKSGTRTLNNLPQNIKNLFNKIERNNPEFIIKYYTDNEARKFIIKNFNKDIVWAYDKLIPGSYKADLFRYCILYINGGIWSDLTDKFLVPINSFIDFNKDKLVLSLDNMVGKEDSIKEKGIQISFMATIPNNKLFLDLINQVVKNCNQNNYSHSTLGITGPIMCGEILDKNKTKYDFFDDIKLLRFDGKYFYDKTNRKIIKWKTLHSDLNNILNRTNKDHYSYLWKNKKVYKNI